MCSGCRKPVSMEEKKSNKYVEGISCPKCHYYLTEFSKNKICYETKTNFVCKKTGKKYIFQKEYY